MINKKRAVALAFAAAAASSMLATPAYAADDENEQNGVVIVQDNQVCNSGDAAGAGLVAVTVPVGNDKPLSCENNPN